MTVEPQKDKFSKSDAEIRFEHLALTVRRKAVAEIKKHKKLIDNLHADLEKHGDADRWKRYGDLLLANVHTATRKGDIISVTDYFDDAVPVVEIEGQTMFIIFLKFSANKSWAGQFMDGHKAWIKQCSAKKFYHIEITKSWERRARFPRARTSGGTQESRRIARRCHFDAERTGSGNDFRNHRPGGVRPAYRAQRHFAV